MARVLLLVCGVVVATVGCWWQSEWIVGGGTVALLVERVWSWHHAAARWRHRAYILTVLQVLACTLLVAFCCTLAVYGNGHPAIIDQIVPRVQLNPAAWVALVWITPEARMLLAFVFAFWCFLADLVIVLAEQPLGHDARAAAVMPERRDGDQARHW